jgi:hypothetical protein
MQKIYLKFTDISECETVIATTDYDVSDENMFVHWPDLAKETGAVATDASGNEYPVMVPIDGHHVDMYIADSLGTPVELAPYTVATPDNPVHRLR